MLKTQFEGPVDDKTVPSNHPKGLYEDMAWYIQIIANNFIIVKRGKKVGNKKSY